MCCPHPDFSGPPDRPPIPAVGRVAPLAGQPGEIRRTEPVSPCHLARIADHRGAVDLLRWDLDVDPAMNGEKAQAIQYEFKLELDKQMTIGSFQSK